jgi:hypothetical protein
LAAGNYTITAAFTTSSGFFANNTNTGTLAVTPAATVISVPTVSVVNGSSGRTLNFSAHVSAPGNNLTEGSVTFTVPGIGSVTAPFSAGGNFSASLAVPNGAPGGSYAVTATFADANSIAGAPNFATASASSTQTVPPAPTFTIVTGVQTSYGLFDQRETVTAKVTSANGAPVTGGTVTFSDNGRTATGNVVNGVATATIDLPFFLEQPNAHTITATFNGLSNLLATSVFNFGAPATTSEYFSQLYQLFILLDALQHGG